MFTDELKIKISAGNGGAGVVRWRQEKFKPRGGPAGGNGGNGGSVLVRAVSDNNVLRRYVGVTELKADSGEDGRGLSQHGANAEDLIIEIPTGSIIRDIEREREYVLEEEGQLVKILKGGRGGLGNERFKSSTNRTPLESTEGKKGETGDFFIEVALVVDVGLVGLPNAGKSSLLNALTNATARVGDYPFTTLQPHLGDLYGITIADIPGIIKGAADGKGLGLQFLRHIKRTKMILHVLSLESENIIDDYEQIRTELLSFDTVLKSKEEWIALSKSDTVADEKIKEYREYFSDQGKKVYIISVLDDSSLKSLRDDLVDTIRN